MDQILLQKKVRDNTEDLQNCLKDLKSWESEMKRKENELLVVDPDSQPSAASLCGLNIPPIRSKKQRIGKVSSTKRCQLPLLLDEEITSKRIPGSDYASWDKFDVDKACQEVDADFEDSGGGTESEEENIETKRFQEEAMYEKEKGNQFVKHQKWEDAIQCYSRAIDCYPYDAIFYANRALCFLKTLALKNAETDCTSALTLDTTYVKAFQRRAAARSGLGLLEEAKSDLEKVMELEPKNATSKQELAKIEKKINAVQKHTKCMMNEEKKKESESGEPNVGINSMSGSVFGKQPIQPVSIPPHLRSKKPMKRIEIHESEECSSNDSITKMIDEPVSRTPVATKIEIQGSESVENPAHYVNSTPIHVENMTNSTSKGIQIEARVPPSTATSDDHKKLPVISHLKTDEMKIPPPPKSYVEFYVGWKKVKKHPNQRFLYLKQTPGTELSKVFQESLESTTFSELLITLETGFLTSKEPVFPYLLGMSNVKRLSALTIFMTNEDRTRIKMLVRSCEESGECSKEDAAMLRTKFEVL